MTNRKLRTVGATALVLGLVALMLILILTALHAVGTDANLYYRLQQDAWQTMDAASAAGISDDDLRMLDGRLAAYLSGDGAALNAPDADGASGTSFPEIVPVEVSGEVRPAFNMKEMAHMEDCFRLFELLRKVRRRLIPWAILLAVGGAYLLQDRKKARLAAWLSPLVLLIPLGAFGIWAAADFDGAFIFFHRLLFSNDLWLLNPRTDLLIRICPESMFMGMGLRIGIWSLAALIGVPALATLITIIWPKNKQDEANKWNDNRATRRASAQKPRTFDFGEKR